MKTVQITETDLIPYEWYGLVCQGCEENVRWRIGPSDTKAVVVPDARRRGWIRIECAGGFRTFCPDCVQVMRDEYERVQRAGAVQ